MVRKTAKSTSKSTGAPDTGSRPKKPGVKPLGGKIHGEPSMLGQSKETSPQEAEFMDGFTRKIESRFEGSRVVWREGWSWDINNPMPAYELVVVAPQFQEMSYEERINKLWPFIQHLPDSIFSRLRGIDCMTPAEFGHSKQAA
jgi:hypothetical protein